MIIFFAGNALIAATTNFARLERIRHNNPSLVVDLGVGSMPMDWNGDGVPDFIGGGEDGHFYYLRNPRHQRAAK